MPDVPVSVVLPDEAKRPPWLAPAVAEAVKNPRFEGGGLWTDGARDGTERLVRSVLANGDVEHYEGEADAERLVRRDAASGEMHHF